MQDDAGNFVHTASGAVFPPQIETLVRADASSFAPDGSDVGATYTESDGGYLVFSEYVYPHSRQGSRVDVASEISMRVGTILSMAEGSNVVRQLQSTLRGRTALVALMRIPASIYIPEATGWYFSFLIVSGEGDWFIEYQLSYPESMNDRYAPLVDRFLAVSPWPGDYGSR